MIKNNSQILESKLGFDRIKTAISNKCNTEYAVNRTLSETFSVDKKDIHTRLILTDEMRLIIMFEDNFPTNGYIDCLDFLNLLQKEGSRIDLLSMGKLRTLLETVAKIKNFFDKVKEGVYPNLSKIANEFCLFPEIQEHIERILDKFGNVKDTASDNLFEIRRLIKDKEGAISKRINAILKKAQIEGYADEDASVVVRDGRLLIPVNTSNKRKINGFVYDESASGKTTYIEPAEVIEIENELNDLRFSESKEIVKILSEFSDYIRPYVPEICIAAQNIGEIDFIMAKAQVALEYIAGMPLISETNSMELRKARHPILEKNLKKEGKAIVPLSITLSENKHILLISGPNAGGKSVCLKTVGLLQYMFQWGMLIPTSETSEMMIFDRIMVDIGDGQSIDNDLSTYSSFLKSMADMLKEANNKTLILIDEFGSGTEPTAGGAIAESILNILDKRGVYGVITTHYTNLKLYANRADSGVINGAMQFDVKNIAPLFKLEIGLPGNSFAFELARKMGLPEEIIKDAETRAGTEFVGIEKNLRKIARNKRVLDEKLQKIKNTDKTLENITDKYQKELEGIKKIKQDIIEQAKQEAQDIVQQANKKVEHTIKEIKESKADRAKTIKARSNLKTFVDALSQKKQEEEKNREDYIEAKLKKLAERKERSLARKAQKADERQKAELLKQQEEEQRLINFRNAPLKVGEKVRLKTNGMVGEVAKVSNKAVTVIIGNINSKLPLDKVERITSNEFKSAIKDNGVTVKYQVEDEAIRDRKLNFKTEIDVRGLRINEALDTVMHYIDDAIMVNVPSVRIIHGKGTGALREEIQRLLKTVHGISSIKDEHIQFGGTGVTIVNFE